MNFFRKDWILYQEIANEGGKKPEALIDVNEKTDSPENNKHVPFITETSNGYEVVTGKTAMHATDNEHHTMFIQLNVDDKFIYRKNISIGEEPKAIFEVPKGKKVVAYAFCNLHGLWKYEYK